jgi:hypothetical protein
MSEEINLSQEKLNQLLAKERRDSERKLRNEFDQERAAAVKERNALQEALRVASASSDDLSAAKQAVAAAEEKLAAQQQNFETEKSSWQTQLSGLQDQLTNVEATSAKQLQEFQAKQAEQNLDMQIRGSGNWVNADIAATYLRNQVKVIDGKAHLDVPHVDPTTLERSTKTLPLSDAIDYIAKKEIDHPIRALVKSNAVGGMGAHNGQGIVSPLPGRINVDKLLQSPGGQEQYMNLRKTKAGRIQLGLENAEQ